MHRLRRPFHAAALLLAGALLVFSLSGFGRPDAAPFAGAAPSPRIVLPAFVVRCSTLPDDAPFRVSRPGYCVNEDGEAIADSGADAAPALEATPELQWEAFDRYWRKIHGPKIIHEDGPTDFATRLLLRYEQQHRIPAGPTSAFRPPYPPQVDEDDLLVTDPHARVPAYQRPRFDGLAQLAYESREDLLTFFGLEPGDKYGDKIIPDEQVFLKGFAFNISREFVLIPDRGTRDPIILVKTHERDASFSRREFQEYWLEEHAKTLTTNGKAGRLVQRYAQLHNISRPEDAPLFDPVGDRFDVISVLSFANVNDLEAFLVSPLHEQLEEAEEEFTEESRFFTAVNFVIINREDVERPTIGVHRSRPGR